MNSCIVCGLAAPDDIKAREKQGWDWFTGYLDRTVHFCPKDRRGPTFSHFMELSQKKPPAGEQWGVERELIRYRSAHVKRGGE